MRPRTCPDIWIPRHPHSMALHELPNWSTLIDLAANLIQLATFALALRAVFCVRRIRNPHRSTRQLARPSTFKICRGHPLTPPLKRSCTNLRRSLPTVTPRPDTTDLPDTVQAATTRPCSLRRSCLMSQGPGPSQISNVLFCRDATRDNRTQRDLG